MHNNSRPYRKFVSYVEVAELREDVGKFWNQSQVELKTNKNKDNLPTQTWDCFGSVLDVQSQQ